MTAPPRQTGRGLCLNGKKPPVGGGFLAGETLFALAFIVPEEHGDAPKARHAHQRVDDAADGAHLAAEEKRHAVEAEKAHAAPIQRADDDQYQRDLVNDLQSETSLK